MRNYILAAIAAILASNSVLAMPCDNGYVCSTTKTKYKIEIQRCRYDNSLKAITSLQIAGKSYENASLSANWDGDKYLAFEIKLPTDGTNTEQLLSVEVLKSNWQGEITKKSRVDNPGVWKVVTKESIRCKISE